MSLVSLTETGPRECTGLTEYVSPTRLNTWLSCPRKFAIKYVDGIKEPPSPGLFLGKRVHERLGVQISTSTESSACLRRRMSQPHCRNVGRGG